MSRCVQTFDWYLLNLSGIVRDASVPPRQQPVKLQGAKFKTTEIS